MKAIQADDGSIEASGNSFEVAEGEIESPSAFLIQWEENEPAARVTSFDVIVQQARRDPRAEVIPIEGEPDFESALSMEAMTEFMMEGGASL